MPSPASDTDVVGPLPPSWSTSRAAAFTPFVAGVNVTSMSRVSPGASTTGPAKSSEKSVASAPVTVTSVTLMSGEPATPVCVRVTVSLVDVVDTTAPRSNDAGASRVTAGDSDSKRISIALTFGFSATVMEEVDIDDVIGASRDHGIEDEADVVSDTLVHVDVVEVPQHHTIDGDVEVTRTVVVRVAIGRIDEDLGQVDEHLDLCSLLDRELPLHLIATGVVPAFRLEESLRGTSRHRGIQQVDRICGGERPTTADHREIRRLCRSISLPVIDSRTVHVHPVQHGSREGLGHIDREGLGSWRIDTVSDLDRHVVDAGVIQVGSPGDQTRSITIVVQDLRRKAGNRQGKRVTKVSVTPGDWDRTASSSAINSLRSSLRSSPASE